MVYTHEELDKMNKKQANQSKWRKIMVFDGIQVYGGNSPGNSGIAGANPPGIQTAQFRFIVCHLTAGQERATIDDPADPKRTANHNHDKNLNHTI